LANFGAIRDGSARRAGTHHSTNRQRSDRQRETASSELRHNIVLPDIAYKPSLNPELITQPPEAKTNKIIAIA
jgi:hypothetical protein